MCNALHVMSAIHLGEGDASQDAFLHKIQGLFTHHFAVIPPSHKASEPHRGKLKTRGESNFHKHV